uniref:Retroviral polymerase SH3-like domain-containing protein n=1 Tax=Solanum lycopersicum TaxID=4081 RepID=A0A3Q7GEH6_SOLLC
MKCAAYVINRMPLFANNMKSPYELMFGEKPNIKNIRVFVSICYVHIPDSQWSNLDPKERKCIFVGYDETKKGWKCIDPKTYRFVVFGEVVFDETSLYYEVTSKGEVARLQEELALIFNIKKLGELHFFLGLELTNTGKGVFITQKGYAKMLVDRFGVKQIKYFSTPLETSTRLRREEDPKTYQVLVGSLLYLTITMPDIAFSVIYAVTKKVLIGSCKAVPELYQLNIRYGPFFKRNNDLILMVYTDTNFSDDKDNRRSTSGYIFLYVEHVFLGAVRSKTQFLYQLRRRNINQQPLLLKNVYGSKHLL